MKQFFCGDQMLAKRVNCFLVYRKTRPPPPLEQSRIAKAARQAVMQVTGRD
jgi:hypothetical protein